MRLGSHDARNVVATCHQLLIYLLGAQIRQTVVLVLLPLLAASCGGTAHNVAMATASPTAEQPPRIALVMQTRTSPFFVMMEEGARRAEREYGITLLVEAASQETSIAQQIALVDNLIREQVDAIVIAPGDSRELIPVLQRATEAGIVVINLDNRLDPEVLDRMGMAAPPFISVDNEEAAYAVAHYLAQQINEPTEVVILEGIPEAWTAQTRKAGAMRALGENPNIVVTASASAHWQIDEAYNVTARLLTMHPEVGAIVSANDMMALGALEYLEEQGRKDVRVTGFDAMQEALEAIVAGTMVATVDQQAEQQGYLGLQYAVRALAGEPLPPETMLDWHLITPEVVNEHEQSQ